MKIVMIESPFAGEVERNIAYAKASLMDSLRKGEAPFAMHLLYPQVLADKNKDERALGIQAGLAWSKVAEAIIFYTDYGMSPGMLLALEQAKKLNKPIEFRAIGSL